MIAAKVKEIIESELGCDHDLVTDDANLFTTLGTDSLDIIEIVMAMEEEFGIDITDEEGEGFQTVGDIVKYVEGAVEG